MNKKNIWEYIQIGTNLRYLQDTLSNNPIKGEARTLNNIKILLKSFLDLNLHVTDRASYELKKFYKEHSLNHDKEYFTSDEASELQEIIKIIRHTMTAECLGIFAYITTDKRYDIDKLSENIDKLFSPNSFSNFPELAKYDFNEAGKCIVFERSTAAAFHILRGTEAILRLYYKNFFRKKIDGLTWGQLLNELKNKKSGKIPAKITLDHLNNIKNSFRNPTQHPEKIYNIEEVQDLLNLCIDVINKMMEEINN